MQQELEERAAQGCTLHDVKALGQEGDDLIGSYRL
jgi:hypothetical protein